MKLSIVIVNYNVRYFLEQVLLSVRRACAGLDAEVWVVDNNSVDDSVPMVREKFPDVKLIANTDNVGFAKANNQAIRLSSGEYVLLLNPDTVVEEDTFARCVAFMDAHPEAGGLGVRMIDGSGKFLPESKRGFPTPWVAFCKTFGLSRLFPRSRRFNRYHLGYLGEWEVNEVDVLAGAFMWLRRSALDKAGLLDEAFFMYGEDIDLSYRIVLAGYKNYYFPDTTIIHYKGESTKKGSLNYVRTFYQAMIIFARKHFKGREAGLFVLMLQAAIYFRAMLTLGHQVLRRGYLPLLDGLAIYGGLVFIKHFWASYHFRDPDYYDTSVLYLNFPLYTSIWLLSIYFSGGYDRIFRLQPLVKGLLAGTVLLAAVYGFLDLAYRTSRALILLGAVWAVTATVGIRAALHLILFGNVDIGREKPRRLVIVGTLEESRRVEQLLHQVQVKKNLIGYVSPQAISDDGAFLGGLSQLDEVVQIYHIEELIFCSKDLQSQDIMRWMSRLGPGIAYKIVPEESLSIIGSHSKNASGELYTIDIKFNIATPAGRRNKRLFDAALALFLLATLPFHLLLVKNRLRLIRHIFKVFLGRATWVGYIPQPNPDTGLPPLKPGILSPLDALPAVPANLDVASRLNFFYAKDYDTWRDVEICWKGYGGL